MGRKIVALRQYVKKMDKTQLRAKALGRAEVKAEYKNLRDDFAQRLPIEIPYTAPTNDELRRAADAVFLELDRREALS